jgi:glycosyltransferase involved in cell wall biosynthesis
VFIGVSKDCYFASMNVPLLSVVMPMYNCAPYLQESISSILNQDFRDFELICINDGSTDDTEKVILSFSDPRISYTRNDENKGLVFTLNKGIDMARGIYIARMDGDDICLPGRFRLQTTFLNNNPGATIVASQVELINEKGDFIGYWEEEKKAVTPEAIRSQLPKDNCIAHPTVMARSEVLKKYKYNALQHQAEDYDLWLRIEADDVAIYKLDEVLVKHRIVTSSFTRKRQQNVFRKNARTKWVFIRQQLAKGKLNRFMLSVFFFLLTDMIKGVAKRVKKIFVRSNSGFY